MLGILDGESDMLVRISLNGQLENYVKEQGLPPLGLSVQELYDNITMTLHHGTRLTIRYATIATNPLQHALESVNWVQLNNHLHDLNDGTITVPNAERNIRDAVSRILTGPVDALDEGKTSHHQITAQLIEDYIEFMQFLVRTNQNNFSDIESQLRGLLTIKELIQERGTQTVDASPDKLRSAWQNAKGLAEEKIREAEAAARASIPGAPHLEAAMEIMKRTHDYENTETWKNIATKLVEGGLEDSIEVALDHLSQAEGPLMKYLEGKGEIDFIGVIIEQESVIRKARKALRSPAESKKDAEKGPKGRK